MNTTTVYNKQAREFLERNGLKMRITEYPADMQSPPRWAKDGKSGLRYRVTLYREGKPGKVAFDFWGSIADRDKIQLARWEQHKTGWQHKPSPYDVLACISGDVNCPETFGDFCSEYGYDEDSREAERTFRRCRKFARNLRKFLKPEEIEQLQEIQ